MDIKEKLKLFHENPVTSWHEHACGLSYSGKLNEEYTDNFVDVMDTLGIDKVVSSLPIASDKHCPPENFIAANNITYEAVKRWPGRIYGMAFVNPGYRDEMLDEIERCTNELGFVGVKLYHHYRMDDPVQFALVEKCIELDIPILMHSAHATDPSTRSRQPRLSDGEHMANIARRYPEATFLMGHIGGGGDWQWSIKAIADCPNVYADMGGSVHDRPLIEESVKYLGADRILFATDGPFCSSVAKILGADISEEDKKTILAGGAFNRFLERTGK